MEQGVWLCDNIECVASDRIRTDQNSAAIDSSAQLSTNHRIVSKNLLRDQLIEKRKQNTRIKQIQSDRPAPVAGCSSGNHF